MSVLIKIDMPENCNECYFVQHGIKDWCYVTEEDIPCDCPLTEVTRQRWISVTERLPASKTKVLVAYRNGVTIAERDGYITDKTIQKTYWRGIHGPKHALATITHWMPLPNPPEECNQTGEQLVYDNDAEEKRTSKRPLTERDVAEWIPLDNCMSFCSNCYGLGCGSKYCSFCGALMENADG